MKQADRAIDWQRDDTAHVLRKINAADGFPGVADSLFGEPCHIFDAWPKTPCAAGGTPGRGLAWRETALLRATVDGAVWIGHVKRRDGDQAAGDAGLCRSAGDASRGAARRLVARRPRHLAGHRYEESGGVGFLHFEFYNGAMSTAQCRRLRAALAWAKQRPVKVLVLMGGPTSGPMASTST
jgi:putative two-component system hydrogenase maturation factor HypX/HoxX